MNMLLRFFIMIHLLKQELKKPLINQNLTIETLSAPTVRYYRILPHDMGFRDHLPNYRYLSFIELNITRWVRTCCHLQGIDTLNWVIAMQEMIYLKEIKLLNKMTLSAALIGWDKKYVYFESRFFVKDQLMGIGMTKFVFKDKQGKIHPPTVLNMQGEQLTDVIDTWNAHQVAVKGSPTKATIDG